MELALPWYAALALFFGGAFVANAIPHLLNGVAGRPFPTPFASPPFRGLSSPGVNIAWSLANLAVAYLLLRPLDPGRWLHWTLAFVGFCLMAFQVARSLRLRRADPRRDT